METEGVRAFYRPGSGHWVGILHLCVIIYTAASCEAQSSQAPVQIGYRTVPHRTDVIVRKATDTVSNSAVFMP